MQEQEFWVTVIHISSQDITQLFKILFPVGKRKDEVFQAARIRLGWLWCALELTLCPAGIQRHFSKQLFLEI